MATNVSYVRVTRGGSPLHGQMVVLDGSPIGETDRNGFVLIPADGQPHKIGTNGSSVRVIAEKGRIHNIDLTPTAPTNPPPPVAKPVASTTNPKRPAMAGVKIPRIVVIGIAIFGVVLASILLASSLIPASTERANIPTAQMTEPEASPSWESPPAIPQLTPLDVANNPWIGMIQVLYGIIFGGVLVAGYLNARERQQVGDWISAAIALLAVFFLFNWEPVRAFITTLFEIPEEMGGKFVAFGVLCGGFFAVLTASLVGGRDLTAMGVYLGGIAIGGALSGKFGILNHLFHPGNNIVLPANQWWALIRTKNFDAASFTTTILILFALSLLSYSYDLVKPDKRAQPAWGAVAVAFISPVIYIVGRMTLPQTPPWILLVALLGIVAIVASLFREFGFGAANLSGNPNRGGVGAFITRPSWDVVGLFLVWGALLVTLSGWV